MKAGPVRGKLQHSRRAIMSKPHEIRVFETSDGTPLHVETWRPEGTPRFGVLVVHGGAEHVSRYDRMAKQWCERGAFVIGPDHRGQGRSGGPRGHVDRFETYARDLLELLRDAVAERRAGEGTTDMPWFIFGHSMGGLITLGFLLEHQEDFPLRGAVISAPMLGLVKPPGPVLRVAARAIGAVLPTIGFPSPIPPEHVSRDPEQVALYANDKRRVTVFTPTWFQAAERMMARVLGHGAEITVPLKLYHGTGDLICDHRVTQRFYRSLPKATELEQSFELFEGYYHELHNEPPDLRAPIERMILDWMLARVPALKSAPT